MAKIILTERVKSVLEYTEKPSTEKGIGHLAGIGADLKNPTRNGRKYPIELWKNVMNSSDYKEMMDTHTGFCETDHPWVERIDTSLKEVCAVLTNMEIREDEGIVWVEFDILDTPQGRILKTLVDYGCKIGVSSRGLGDEIQRNGETIIDPDTYSFYGFDMVVQPAVKAARPDKVESIKKAKVTDVFKKEIENAATVTELQSLKRLAESVNMPDLDSITESINNKLSNGSTDGNNISEQLENDLGKLAEENESLKTQLESLKSANNISVKQNRRITETYKKEAITARRTLRQLEVKSERLERVNREMTDKLYEESSKFERLDRKHSKDLELLNGKIEESESEIHRLRQELSEAKKENLSLVRELETKNRQLESLTHSVSDSKSRIAELENEVSDQAFEIDSLTEQNSSLGVELEKVNTKSQMTENRVQDVSNKLTEQGNHLTEVLVRYLDAKCLSEGIEKDKVSAKLPTNYTIQDIDMVVEKLSDEKRRLNKMPISLDKPITAKLENFNGMSPEDAQTMRFLTGFTP